MSEIVQWIMNGLYYIIHTAQGKGYLALYLVSYANVFVWGTVLDEYRLIRNKN